MIEIPPDICRKTVAQYEKHDSGRGSADWPAYLRLLDRVDPELSLVMRKGRESAPAGKVTP